MLAAMLLMVFPFTALAAPATPGAGTLLQQIRPQVPPAPSSNETGLSLRKEGGARLPPSAPFPVKTIKITGNTKVDTATLHALVAAGEGKRQTLAQLEALAGKITDYYHAQGYPLARAIIPAQTIHDGVVEIEVIEARYGKIDLHNGSRVRDPLLKSTLSPLQSGAVIEQKPMDHALLLLSDITGVVVNATLLPGEAVGTADLQVETSPGPAVVANLALDDYGNQYTGRNRVGGTLSLIDPLHRGDVLSLSGLSSGSGMNYARVSYDALVNGYGTHIGASLSALHYILGDTLSNLGGHGTAQVVSLWVKHPLMRTRNFNLYGQIQVDRTTLKDHLDASLLRTDRHLDNWTGSLSGDARDVEGLDTWSLGLTSGREGFDDAAAQLVDAATARTQGSFQKWNLSVARQQSLWRGNVLYLALTGQWANANLDASQQMVAGGPYTVRAYDMGAVSGDAGYLGTVELRHELGYLHGQWQAIVFYDSEHVTVNRNTWTAGANSATLSGAGLGLDWSGPGKWSARAYVATRIDTPPTLAANASTSRAWVELSKGFSQ